MGNNGNEGLSAGKWRRLASLADEQGRFKMLAVDQRGSLQRSIAKAAGKDAGDVSAEEIAGVKAMITKALAPHASAVLTDPVYGLPQSYRHIPPRVGLLLTYDETGHEKAGRDNKERLSKLIEGWSVEQAQRAHANAVKLVIFYRPDGSEEVCGQQQELVRRVGEECARWEMPFLFELLGYPIDEGDADSPAYARAKPDIVIESAREFSDPRYGVDILKLEFPADLKHTREFARGAFDGREREPAYGLDEVRSLCDRLDRASRVPWVILSAGVGIDEFLMQVQLATVAGASGFLCGRAIWKDALDLYPDRERMEAWLSTEGVYNFLRSNAYAERALPWTRRVQKEQGTGNKEPGPRPSPH
jgi:tagatose 1,6-diphosphate aldolase